MACLRSVLAADDATPREVVVIDDASPDADLVGDLTALAEAGRITLLRNPRNLGFPATVNRGLALHPDRDAVLLNADTLVAGNWLERLRAAARSVPDVGTVTPLSNDATILSYPSGADRPPPAVPGGNGGARPAGPDGERRAAGRPADGGRLLRLHPTRLPGGNRPLRGVAVRARLWRGERLLPARAPVGLAPSRGRRRLRGACGRTLLRAAEGDPRRAQQPPAGTAASRIRRAGPGLHRRRPADGRAPAPRHRPLGGGGGSRTGSRRPAGHARRTRRGRPLHRGARRSPARGGLARSATCS
nr:glycosyltransferase [Azospirillum brasilense]